MHRVAAALSAALMTPALLAGGVPAQASPPDDPTDGRANVITTSATPRTSLTWRACGSGMPSRSECATMVVPRDWGDPTVTGTYRVAVARIPARKPSQRVGILTFNPGGPGSRGVSNIGWVQGMLPASVRDRFDIVAWDPRGVGNSQPSLPGCRIKDVEPPATGPVDWEAWARTYVQAQAKAGKTCYRANRQHAPYVGTWQLVRDVDALRAALGEEQITFWGMSYGTTVGRAYAQYFPQRVRALVLDGVISPVSSIELWAREHTWDDPLAIDIMLTALGPKYRRMYDRVMTKLQTRTLRASDGKRMTRWTVGKDIISWASYQSTWRSAARLLERVDAGLKTSNSRVRQRAIDDAASMLSTSQALDPRGWLTPQWTYVNCADMPGRPTAARLAEIAREGALAGGVHVGQAVLREGAQCAGLPRFGRPIPRILTPITLTTPPIIANALGDNRTPWTAAVEMSRAFPGSRTVQYGGTHHIVYGRTTSCVAKPITRYLISQQLPSRDVTCPLRY